MLLVRHAEAHGTGVIAYGRMSGIALTERGELQAEGTAQLLASAPIKAIYSSPLQRTIQTANAISKPHGIKVTSDPRLLEVDNGTWEGVRLVELEQLPEAKEYKESPSTFRFPYGESIKEMQERMIEAFLDIVSTHRGETVVLVSHGDPLKGLLTWLKGQHLDLVHHSNIDPAEAVVIESRGGEITINGRKSFEQDLGLGV